MSTPHEYLEGALRDLHRQQRLADEAHRRLEGASSSATSPDHAVTVTVNGRAELVDVTFHDTRYKSMAPAELGRLIVSTAARARLDAMGRMTELFAASVPAGLDPAEVMAGRVNVEDLLDGILDGQRGLGLDDWFTVGRAGPQHRDGQQEHPQHHDPEV